MFASFPLAWFILGLPFVSAAIIAQVPALRKLASTHNSITWPVGLLALACLLAGLLGRLSPLYELPLTVIAGMVSGFAVFWKPHKDSGTDDDDGRWRRPPPDEPPPAPVGDGPDWALFDRLRAQWERPRVPSQG